MIEPRPNCNCSSNTQLHASKVDVARVILVVLVSVYLVVNIKTYLSDISRQVLNIYSDRFDILSDHYLNRIN
jgi:hypothetical protein